MNKKTLLIFSLCLSAKSIKAAPQKPKDNRNSKSEINKFHVSSRIQLRYAITDVEAELQNRQNETKEVFFDMYIPENAFVSNFTMDIKGKAYHAAVRTKDVTQDILKENHRILQTTWQPEFKDGKQVNNYCMQKEI